MTDIRSTSDSSGDRALLWSQPNEVILAEYRQRSHKASKNTIDGRVSKIRAGLRRYGKMVGEEPPALLRVVTDAGLLSAVLQCDKSLFSEQPILTSYLGQLRTALSDLIWALPEPRGYSRARLDDNLHAASNAVSTRWGLRRRLEAGRPTAPDNRYIPSSKEIRRVIAALAAGAPAEQATGRLVRFLFEMNVRLGAALALTPRDVMRSEGVIVVRIHEKSRDPRLVRFPFRGPDLGAALAGPTLFSYDRAALTPRVARRCLARAAAASGIPYFSPHRLRNSVATELAEHVSMDALQRHTGHAATRVAEGYIRRAR